MARKTDPYKGQNIFQRQSQDYKAHNKSVQPAKEEKQREHGVWQDKGAADRARLASSQPAPHTKSVREQELNRPRVRSTKLPANRTRSAKITLWVNPIVKAELERIAQREGLSLSAAGAAFLEEALRQKLHAQQTVLLQPIIAQAIRKEMRAISTRLAWLLVRVAYDSGQTRSLVTNILGRQPGVSPDILKTILDNSSKTARGNITRRTPQIEQLIEAVENWIMEDEETDKLIN